MKKYIVFGVIILFVGACVTSSISGNIQKYNTKSNLDNHEDYNNLINQAFEKGVISYITWLEQDKLIASDGSAGDWFGRAVSISGDYAVIGAEYDEDYGPSTGAAYIFQRNGSTWTEVIKLLPLDPNDGDLFGHSVAISGDYAIIGSIFDDDNGYESGSAYIFKRENTTWLQHTKLIASDGDGNDRFGKSVSIDGDYAIVGARYDYNNGQRTGSAYIFKRNGSTWTEQVKLLASDAGGDANFGLSVSISGYYVIIGAPHHADNGDFAGAAYIFKRNDTTWYEQNRLLASDGDAMDFFGCSVSVSGDYAIVGAYGYTNGGWDEAGAAYIFKRNGTTWYELDKLLPSDVDKSDRFGFSVSIDDNYVIVGSPWDFPQGQYSGSAYVFNFNGTNWIEQDKIYASDGDEFDQFGNSVSINGNYSIIGAYKDDDDGGDSGSAYVFNKSEIPNQPPFIPSNPDPYDGETNVDINHDLTWTGGDPDGDPVTYDVYFGATTPPPEVATGISDTTYDPGTLDYGTTYYWKIVSWDDQNAFTQGPIWEFTTVVAVPDLDCDGSLSWTEVTPGETVTDTFTVENIGSPGTLLDWEIESYPEWGTWTFTPDMGTDLTPEDGEVTISVEVIAPEDTNTEFTGEIKIGNSENPYDYCIIDVSLATPVNQQSSNSFFMRFLERFPNAFPILRHLLGL